MWNMRPCIGILCRFGAAKFAVQTGKKFYKKIFIYIYIANVETRKKCADTWEKRGAFNRGEEQWIKWIKNKQQQRELCVAAAAPVQSIDIW